MMYRTPLLMLVREKLKTSFTNLPPSSDTINLQIKALAQVCFKASSKTIRLFEILRKNDYLARFSFTDFHGCSIATIILLLHGILEREVGYEGVVTFAMESLAWMASDNKTANVGLRFVESFRGLADEAVERIAAQSQFEGPGPGEKAKEVEGYKSWLQWMSNSASTRDTPSDGLGDLVPESSTSSLTEDASAQPDPLPPDLETMGGLTAPQGDLNTSQ